MKILKLEQKEGFLRAIIQSYEDLLTLSYVISGGDRLAAYSRRKITIGKEHVIKTVKIGIDVEKTQLSETGLALSGKIFSSSDEDIPLHKYHTIYLKPKVGFILKKQKMLAFQVKLLRRSQERMPKIFVCVYEPGHAIFYSIINGSTKKKYELKENVSGKRFKNDSRGEFFDKLSGSIKEEYQKSKWGAFIVAGKAMDNEELKNGALSGLNISYYTVSYAETGLRELISKDLINQLLKGTKLALQRESMKSYLEAISSGDKNYVYGKEKIADAIDSKTIKEAIITRDFAMSNLGLIEKLDSAGTELFFFDEKDNSFDQLSGFGGIILKLE